MAGVYVCARAAVHARSARSPRATTAEPSLSVVRLQRPTGQAERDLVEASGWLAWPPRLPEQPIFYPVLNEWYATKIAREWNVPHAGVGYVMEFDVDAAYLSRALPCSRWAVAA